MSVPIILPAGVVSVYGAGTTVSASGIIAPTGFLFGYVDAVYDGGSPYVTVGDSLMFMEKDVIDRLVYGSGVYTLVPARLATKEIIPP